MKPEHKALATAWYHYTQGHQQHRPTITPALERHMAKFGIVDPQGYPYTETGRDMQRPIGGKKVFNQQPDALKQAKQNSNSLDYNLPFQRAEQELLWDTLVKEELAKMASRWKPDDNPHPEVVKALNKIYPELAAAAKDMGIAPPRIQFAKGLGRNCLAQYRMGTVHFPAGPQFLVDATAHVKGAKQYDVPIHAALHGTLFHELGHAFVNHHGVRLPNEEEHVENFSRQTWDDAHHGDALDGLREVLRPHTTKPLAKTKPTPLFPKLGVPENRRETKITDLRGAHAQNKRTMHGAFQSEKFHPEVARPVRARPLFGQISGRAND